MVIWGGFSGTPWRYIPKCMYTMGPVFAHPIWNCSTAFTGWKVESHRVNAGNDLGGQLGHNDDNDAGQQPGLQQQGLRVELASWEFQVPSWDFPPAQSRELGRGIHQGFSHGLSSAWPRRRRGKQQKPDKLWTVGGRQNDRSVSKRMGSIKTCRPMRNLSMLSPLAAIWPSLRIV